MTTTSTFFPPDDDTSARGSVSGICSVAPEVGLLGNEDLYTDTTARPADKTPAAAL
jgi:hypothetical protein